MGTESSAAAVGPGQFPRALDLGSDRLQTRGFCSQREFSSPALLDEAALKGLGLGCSGELDPSISIASTPTFGDTGGHKGPRNPPAPPPSHILGALLRSGNRDAAAQPLPGCSNGSDECFGLLWDFFSNHFFGFLFNLKCLSRLWLSRAPPRLTPCLQHRWDPPRAPPNLAQGWGLLPCSLHPWGARCQTHPSAPAPQGIGERGRNFGGCEVSWAGIALQKEDQQGRKSRGRNQKEKRRSVPAP